MLLNILLKSRSPWPHSPAQARRAVLSEQSISQGLRGLHCGLAVGGLQKVTCSGTAQKVIASAVSAQSRCIVRELPSVLLFRAFSGSPDHFLLIFAICVYSGFLNLAFGVIC